MDIFGRVQVFLLDGIELSFRRARVPIKPYVKPHLRLSSKSVTFLRLQSGLEHEITKTPKKLLNVFSVIQRLRRKPFNRDKLELFD